MRLAPFLLVALLGDSLLAQAPDPASRAPGATVTGVVRDSLGRAPLAGAVVQLAGADRTSRFGRSAIADSLGRFALADVPDGRYRLGFFHPLLDSLGVEPPLREVVVEGRRPVRADLSTPSPAALRTAICGARPATDSAGVVVGVVRDAADRTPASGVTVSGEWQELSFTPTGLVRRTPRLVATTGENGWFAICNVPNAGLVALTASRGADSTDLVEVQMPADGFLRRELYLGAARTVLVPVAAPADSASHPESAAPRAPRRMHVGDGRLSGVVVTSDGGRPLPGARVSLTQGPETGANERGEWTLADAPVGTRMLSVRAVGYYPEHRPVDVAAGAPPLRIALSTIKAVLDTVRITASRIRFDRDRNGFQERRRTGMGRYLTPEDVQREHPIRTSDLFRNVAGVRLDRGAMDSTSIQIRSPFGWCSPVIYMDGHYMTGLSADDIDSWLRPKEVVGIEIYAGSAVPAQFQSALTGCGSIVIWSR